MSVTFDILNISLEELNDSEKMLLISFYCECKEKNLVWKFDKPYEIMFSYFKILSTKIPNISSLPSISKSNIEDQNSLELFRQNLKQYLSNIFKRKEIYKFSSFQRLFELNNNNRYFIQY